MLLRCCVLSRRGSKDEQTDRKGLGRACMSPWKIKYCMSCLEKLGEVDLPCSRRTERGFVLRHILGRLLPAKEGFCLESHAWRNVEEVRRSSASLEGLSRLVPLAPSVPPKLGRLYTQIKPKRLPPHTADCLPGMLLLAALCLFFAEPSDTNSCFQTLPSGSHSARLLSSKYLGKNTPLVVPRTARGSAQGM